MGDLSAAALAPLSSDFAWQQLLSPAANTLEGAAADSTSAAALAALESVLKNAPSLGGAVLPAVLAVLALSPSCCVKPAHSIDIPPPIE